MPPRSSSFPRLLSNLTLQRWDNTGRRVFTASARRPAPADWSGLKDVLHVSDEVKAALATNKPVVALESTIYTHGAFTEDLGLEEIVRSRGCVPAVCGVFEGRATVGLEKHQIERMVRENPMKVSRRDFARIIGSGLGGHKKHGGTTISGTMILARLAGIRVFGTGGLGGVHRGGQDSMDISADLTELGRTRVAVVSSGCKGFLDIPRTLEYLETQGVMVATFVKTDPAAGEYDIPANFPAFWARDSGVKSPHTVRTNMGAARMIYAQEKLGIESGLLLANPIPEEFAIPREGMEDAIDRAVRDAERGGFTGSNNTPFILQRIKEYTEGRSVPANLALVRDNVDRASGVALCLSQLLESGGPVSRQRSREHGPNSFSTTISPKRHSNHMKQSEGEDHSMTRGLWQSGQEQPTSRPKQEQDGKADVLVAGAVALDLSCDYMYAGNASESGSGKAQSPKLHTSNPATISQSVGGVGHNVALAVHRISGGEVKVNLCSVVGDDIAGATVLFAIAASGLSTTHIRREDAESGARTAQYVAVNDSQKSLVLGMADMDILTSRPFSQTYWSRTIADARPKYLVVDANWAPSAIRSFLALARDALTVFEPVSAAKSQRLFTGDKLRVFPRHQVAMAAPNIHELLAMYEAADREGYFEHGPWYEAVDRMNIRDAAAVDYHNCFSGNGEVRLDGILEAGVREKMLRLLPYIQTIVAKLGDQGVLLAEIMAPHDRRLTAPEHQQYILAGRTLSNPDAMIGGVYMRLYPAVERVSDVVSVNGVGDTFLGALVAVLARGGTVHEYVDLAQKAAVMTLRSREAVSPGLEELKTALP